MYYTATTQCKECAIAVLNKKYWWLAKKNNYVSVMVNLPVYVKLFSPSSVSNAKIIIIVVIHEFENLLFTKKVVGL